MSNIEPADRIIASRRVSADDVVALRRAFYGDDGLISQSEADALFAINDACTDTDAAWGELFSEALSDYLVHDVKPAGYVSQDNANWLVERITSDGSIRTACELDLLVRVIEIASEVPESLETFALNHVKQAVLSGSGVTRSGKSLAPGRVTEADVEMLRRIMYAYGGGRNIAVSRAEAEVLFDISDATDGADNTPAWLEFFVKAVANHVMSVSGYRAPSREQALKRETWLDDASVDVGGFFSRILSGGLRGVLSAYTRSEKTFEQHAAALDAEVAAAERIDAGEASWLAERIGRDGKLNLGEKALLQFIRAESADIHPDLKPLLDKAA